MRKQSIQRFLSIILIVSLLCLLYTPVKADEEREEKVVRIACGMNDALYLDENGNPAGICLPYIRQLAWNNNWTWEYVEGSYNESLQNLCDGKVDIMFPVGEDEDTEGKMLYSDFLCGYQQIGLFAKEDSDIYYDDYASFDGKKVGISIGSNSRILDKVAEKNNFSYEAVSLNTVQDKIDALMNGDVDMVSFSTLNSVPGGKLVAVLDQIPTYFCTSKDNPELMEEVNASMRMSMVNTPDLVADMYNAVLNGYNKVSFTKAETQEIEKSETIVFGVYGDRLPLAGIDSKGDCVGIYVDLIKEIAAETNLNLEVIPIEDSDKLYSYLDDGTVDFVMSVLDLRYSSDNAENHLASNKITDFTTVAVTRSDYQVKEKENPRVVIPKSRDYLKDFVYSEFPSAQIEYLDSRKACLDEVEDGSADITFINTWEFNYESKNERFYNLVEWESIRYISELAIGATRDTNVQLLSIFEKTISQLPAEKISDIISGNMNMEYQDYNLQDRLFMWKEKIVLLGIVLLMFGTGLAVYLHIKRKYIKGLEGANKAKSDFLSRMSHELRTPLNAINGYADCTEEELKKDIIEKPVIAKNMNSIKQASGYLLGIITDILDVQRMETGKYTLKKEPITTQEYMKRITDMLHPMVNEKNIDFTYKMINGEEDVYMMDGLRVVQILSNILYNAVKFTPYGGKVSMTSEVIDRDHDIATICYTIKDTGIGMSKEFVETRLFQKFTQENSDTTSPYEGCGIGLAICKDLVEMMDGEILCTSELDKGTIFKVVLKAEYKAKPSGITKRRMEVKHYDLSGIRVLLCEDNKMNQDIEKRLLERMNCKVDIAGDGQIGLDKFQNSQEGTYSVILMDIRMPNMDGWETTRHIRELNRKDAKNIPILAVSANAFEEDIVKSKDAGMNDHLAKPVNVKILYEKIKCFCGIEGNEK